MSDIFLSYASEDRDRVRPLAEQLEARGYTVWSDTRIGVGSSFDREIQKQLDAAACVLVVWSELSVESEWVREEAQDGLDRDILLPVQIDECRLPIGFRRVQSAQLIGWPKERGDLNGVLERLAQLASPSHSAERPTEELTNGPATTDEPTRSIKPQWILGVAALVLAAAGVYLWQQHRAELEWLEEVAMPELRGHLEDDQHGLAYLKAVEIEERLGDGALPTETWDEVSATVSIETSPDGAMVNWRFYDDPDGWTLVGLTPIKARLPRDVLVLRHELEGHRTTLRAGHVPGAWAMDEELAELLPAYLGTLSTTTLPAADRVPADMVEIPASDRDIAGPDTQVSTGGFLIDRSETTNSQFQEFVIAGGYQSLEWWEELDGQVNPAENFVDATGAPGPSGWEFGKFLPGTEQHPVHGISWFEAMAYARFRNKTLPSKWHWLRAGQSPGWRSINPSLFGRANFSGETQAVGASASIGPNGTMDMAGNVAEWTFNLAGDDRLVLGAASDQAPYFFYEEVPVSPWERNRLIGIRAARYLERPDPDLLADASPPAVPPEAEPMPREIYLARTEVYRRYVPFDREPVVVSETEEDFGTLRIVSMRSGTGDDRYLVYFFIPDGIAPPYQTVLYMGGASGFIEETPMETEIPWVTREVLSMPLRSGRVVAWPMWFGSFERYDGLSEVAQADLETAWINRVANWRKEGDAVIDYVNNSDAFSDGVAWLGFSFGAINTAELLFLIPEIKAAVYVVGGNWRSIPWTAALTLEVTTPLLMLNGKLDRIVPPEVARRLYNSIATPDEHKRLVMMDSDHFPFPRGQVGREMNAWLDRYLGPVPR